MSQFNWQALPPWGQALRSFISYQSSAVDLAVAVEEELSGAGNQVWRDKRSLPVGDQWRMQIAEAIDWCQRLIVLLTPGAEDSGEVLAEVLMALEKGRRVEAYCIGSVARLNDEAASETARRLYAALAHLHIAEIEDGPEQKERVCATIRADELASHPMDEVVFRRVYSKRSLAADELGTLSSSVVQTYLSGRKGPMIDGACLTINYALMLANQGKSSEALALLEESSGLEHPLIDLYLSALLCDGKRIGVLAPTRRKRAIEVARRAFQSTKAPLPGLHLCLCLWDAGLKRGPGAAQMIVSAIEALAKTPTDYEELQRYLLIFPVEKLHSPVEGAELKSILRNL